MSVEIANYAIILIELAKAVKMHNFYPEGHPQLDAALTKSYLQLKKCIELQGELKWRLDQKGFYDGKTQIAPGNAEGAALAKRLFFRKVKELTFTSTVSMHDLRVLLSIIKAEPEEVAAKGGVEAMFATLDVEGILLNELHYEDLKRLKSEIQRQKEEEEERAAQEARKPEEQSGASSTAQEEEPGEKPEEERDETSLEEFLRRANKENDLLKYNDLAIRIKEKLDPLLAEKDIEKVYPALMTFYAHAVPSSGKTEGIRATALEKLKSLLNRDVLAYLALKAGAKENQQRGATQSILVYSGDPGAEALLDAIIEAPEAATRRHLFNALVRFGSRLRPLAEARLNHPAWFVCRQMVSLLGDVGGQEAIPALEGAYTHEEPRVKKEVMKSLVKIGTPRAATFLIEKLREEDPSLMAQAIISLGMLKDPASIEPLAEIASKRENFSDLMESQKEAVKALGIIGNSRAVPHLEKILFRKVWFGKKANDELRLLAALSLGMIGTPEALKAVREASSRAAGELQTACKRVLDGREKTI
ncbi:MAG: HEAT repeat domain-containing protein [Deltaproteobacteria bacterium]|nr:HEAT repeat domain-containing protein [Deltaproteobacteria bacterium]